MNLGTFLDSIIDTDDMDILIYKQLDRVHKKAIEEWQRDVAGRNLLCYYVSKYCKDLKDPKLNKLATKYLGDFLIIDDNPMKIYWDVFPVRNKIQHRFKFEYKV